MQLYGDGLTAALVARLFVDPAEVGKGEKGWRHGSFAASWNI